MPELPDIAAYLDALEARIVGQPLQRIRLASAFLLRTANRRPTVWRATGCGNYAESASALPLDSKATSGLYFT